MDSGKSVVRFCLTLSAFAELRKALAESTGMYRTSEEFSSHRLSLSFDQGHTESSVCMAR